MPAKILSGKVIADEIKSEVAAEAASLRDQHGITPCLVAVRVGEDPASAVYVESKVKTAGELGIAFGADSSSMSHHRSRVADIVSGLNERDDVDGILVQLPLPKHINERPYSRTDRSGERTSTDFTRSTPAA